MNPILTNIADCVAKGKADKTSPYPPAMKNMPGAYELTAMALELGIPAKEVLENGLIAGMQEIGRKFKDNKAFVPEVLMSAKAMNKAMVHLKPLYESNALAAKGVVIIGTVTGDLHDIGKNIVAMLLRGNGWDVIDLGVNVSSEKFIEAAIQNNAKAVCMSALLTTTMLNMRGTISKLKERSPEIKSLVGGAPVSEEYAREIGADFYSADPQGAVDFLRQLV